MGGAWYAINGWLTWALGELDGEVPRARDYAFDEFRRNTLTAHARAYPQHWNGVISVDDVCWAHYSSDPSRCGIGILDGWTTQIMHQPSWSLFAALKLAGLDPVRDGYRIDPHLPMASFSLRLPDAGVEYGRARARGYLRPHGRARLRMTVELPRGLARGRVAAFVDGRRVRARTAGGAAPLRAQGARRSRRGLGGRAPLGVEVAALADDEDRRDGAVAGRRDHVVHRRAVGIDHDGLVLVVELEDVGGGVDAVARADAEGPVDRDLDPVDRGEGHCQRRRITTNAAIAASTSSGSSASGERPSAGSPAWPLRSPPAGIANSSAARMSWGGSKRLGSGGRRSSRVPMPNSSAASTSCGCSMPAGSRRQKSGLLIVPIVTTPMDEGTQVQLEAAAFRRLVEHLRERADVQNIDLMELAGFCRNCLSRWYREAAEERGVELTDPQAREIVYGMPYEEWKSRHQT